MIKRIVIPNVCRIMAAILALHFIGTEATAQPLATAQPPGQPDWYVSAGVSGNLVYGMNQLGWNADATCYPINSCFSMDPRPEISGYRWRYDPSIDRGFGFDVAVGRTLGRARLEVSFSQRKNNVEQGASTGGGFVDESLSLPPAVGTVKTNVTAFIDDLVTRTTSLQGYYDLPLGASRLTAYVGLGGGIAFVELSRVFFSIEYSDPSGSVQYDPPLSSYNSQQDTGMTDTVFVVHCIAGVDYSLHARTAIGLSMTFSRAGGIRHDGPYDHHPYHGTDPSLIATNTFSASNRLSVVLNVKYRI